MAHEIEALQKILDDSPIPDQGRQMKVVLSIFDAENTLTEIEREKAKNILQQLQKEHRYTVLRNYTYFRIIEWYIELCAVIVQNYTVLHSPSICNIVLYIVEVLSYEVQAESSNRRTCELLRNWIFRPTISLHGVIKVNLNTVCNGKRKLQIQEQENLCNKLIDTILNLLTTSDTLSYLYNALEQEEENITNHISWKIIQEQIQNDYTNTLNNEKGYGRWCILVKNKKFPNEQHICCFLSIFLSKFIKMIDIGNDSTISSRIKDQENSQLNQQIVRLSYIKEKQNRYIKRIDRLWDLIINIIKKLDNMTNIYPLDVLICISEIITGIGDIQLVEMTKKLVGISTVSPLYPFFVSLCAWLAGCWVVGEDEDEDVGADRGKLQNISKNKLIDLDKDETNNSQADGKKDKNINTTKAAENIKNKYNKISYTLECQKTHKSQLALGYSNLIYSFLHADFFMCKQSLSEFWEGLQWCWKVDPINMQSSEQLFQERLREIPILLISYCNAGRGLNALRNEVEYPTLWYSSALIPQLKRLTIAQTTELLENLSISTQHRCTQQILGTQQCEVSIENLPIELESVLENLYKDLINTTNYRKDKKIINLSLACTILHTTWVRFQIPKELYLPKKWSIKVLRNLYTINTFNIIIEEGITRLQLLSLVHGTLKYDIFIEILYNSLQKVTGTKQITQFILPYIRYINDWQNRSYDSIYQIILLCINKNIILPNEWYYYIKHEHIINAIINIIKGPKRDMTLYYILYLPLSFLRNCKDIILLINEIIDNECYIKYNKRTNTIVYKEPIWAQIVLQWRSQLEKNPYIINDKIQFIISNNKLPLLLSYIKFNHIISNDYIIDVSPIDNNYNDINLLQILYNILKIQNDNILPCISNYNTLDKIIQEYSWSIKNNAYHTKLYIEIQFLKFLSDQEISKDILLKKLFTFVDDIYTHIAVINLAVQIACKFFNDKYNNTIILEQIDYIISSYDMYSQSIFRVHISKVFFTLIHHKDTNLPYTISLHMLKIVGQDQKIQPAQICSYTQTLWHLQQKNPEICIEQSWNLQQQTTNLCQIVLQLMKNDCSEEIVLSLSMWLQTLATTIKKNNYRDKLAMDIVHDFVLLQSKNSGIESNSIVLWNILKRGFIKLVQVLHQSTIKTLNTLIDEVSRTWLQTLVV